jgi:hypothetical protein
MEKQVVLGTATQAPFGTIILKTKSLDPQKALETLRGLPIETNVVIWSLDEKSVTRSSISHYACEQGVAIVVCYQSSEGAMFVTDGRCVNYDINALATAFEAILSAFDA